MTFAPIFMREGLPMLESKFQKNLVKELEDRFPGSVVIKNDPTHNQGFPDLTIFYKDRWATLECKASSTSSHQPNQDHYVDKLNQMSFSRFIFPENKEEVLNELQQAFGSRKPACISKCKQVSLD